MNWTTELPKEDGFYWYRNPAWPDSIDIVEFETEMPWIKFCGNDCPHGPDFYHKINGEFWPVKLTPPS